MHEDEPMMLSVVPESKIDEVMERERAINEQVIELRAAVENALASAADLRYYAFEAGWLMAAAKAGALRIMLEDASDEHILAMARAAYREWSAKVDEQ